MIIILNGLTGSGKSTTGKALAKTLSYPFIDLDKRIINNLNMSIPNIFKEKGEDYFRSTESETLKATLKEYKDNLVLSLGGGTFKDNNNVELCLNVGLVIWLNPSLDIIANRLKDFAHRPLLQNSTSIKKTLENLMVERVANYTKSHIKLDFNKNYPTKYMVEYILKAINEYNAGNLNDHKHKSKCE